MEKSTNAGMRLHEILKAVNKNGPGKSHRQAWAVTFGLKENETIEIFRRLAALHELTEEVEQAIRGIPDIRHETYLENLPKIRSLIAHPQLDAPWNQQAFLPEVAVKDMLYCANKINEGHTEEALGEDELKKLASEVGDLFAEVEASEIDARLRRTLLELLELMRRSMSEYRIRGTKGLREMLARAFGELWLEQQTVKKEPKQSVVWKVFDFSLRLATRLNKLSQFKELAPPAIRVLRGMLSDRGDSPDATV